MEILNTTWLARHRKIEKKMDDLKVVGQKQPDKKKRKSVIRKSGGVGGGGLVFWGGAAVMVVVSVIATAAYSIKKKRASRKADNLHYDHSMEKDVDLNNRSNIYHRTRICSKLEEETKGLQFLLLDDRQYYSCQSCNIHPGAKSDDTKIDTNGLLPAPPYLILEEKIVLKLNIKQQEAPLCWEKDLVMCDNSAETYPYDYYDIIKAKSSSMQSLMNNINNDHGSSVNHQLPLTELQLKAAPDWEYEDHEDIDNQVNYEEDETIRDTPASLDSTGEEPIWPLELTEEYSDPNALVLDEKETSANIATSSDEEDDINKVESSHGMISEQCHQFSNKEYHDHQGENKEVTRLPSKMGTASPAITNGTATRLKYRIKWTLLAFVLMLLCLFTSHEFVMPYYLCIRDFFISLFDF